MHRLTIAERVIAVALLPLLVYFVVQWLGVQLAVPEINALATFVPPVIGVAAMVLAVAAAYAAARSLSGPLAQARETIEAIVRAELGSAPELGRHRSEIDQLIAGIDQLTNILREQQRRDLVLIDVGRKRRSAASRQLDEHGKRTRACNRDRHALDPR